MRFYEDSDFLMLELNVFCLDVKLSFDDEDIVDVFVIKFIDLLSESLDLEILRKL